jgi:hypothetical protein
MSRRRGEIDEGASVVVLEYFKLKDDAINLWRTPAEKHGAAARL